MGAGHNQYPRHQSISINNVQIYKIYICIYIFNVNMGSNLLYRYNRLRKKTLKRIYDLHPEIKIFLSGSNASILKEELGVLLAGRFAYFELFPFNFTVICARWLGSRCQNWLSFWWSLESKSCSLWQQCTCSLLPLVGGKWYSLQGSLL